VRVIKIEHVAFFSFFFTNGNSITNFYCHIIVLHDYIKIELIIKKTKKKNQFYYYFLNYYWTHNKL